MIESTIPEPKHKNWRSRVLDAWQLIFVLLTAIIMSVLIPDLRKLDVPGAPLLLFSITAALGVVLLVSHWPSIFERLPSRWRGVPYIAWVGYFFLVNTALTQISLAWERTPQGAAEAKKAEAERKAFDAEWARTQKIDAEAEAQRQRDGAALKEAENLQERVQEQAAKLEDCFTTFGHRLPALENPFKENLHNPDAYEHVATLAIVPNFEGHNVAMKFRAENGMGAIRLGAVTAKVDPESCEIVTVGDPELM